VGRDDDGLTFLVKKRQTVQKFLCQRSVQVSGWLIGDNYLGVIDQRPGDGNPLLLST
jgi:hypothetical protein